MTQRCLSVFTGLHNGFAVFGADDAELAQQMYEQWGDVPFYIARVEKEPAIYELPSPEVVC